MFRSFPLQLSPPNFDRSVRRPCEDQGIESRNDGVYGVVVGCDGLQALGVRDAPHLHGLVPGAGVQQSQLFVQAHARNGVEMFDTNDAPVSSGFHVIFWVDGALEEVFEGGQASITFEIVSVGNLPDPDFAVLVAGESPVAAYNNGFDQPTIGFKPGELLEILPNAYVLTIRTRVQQIPGNR